MPQDAQTELIFLTHSFRAAQSGALLFDHTGWRFARSGDKASQFTNTMKALAVLFDVTKMAFGITFIKVRLTVLLVGQLKATRDSAREGRLRPRPSPQSQKNDSFLMWLFTCLS